MITQGKNLEVIVDDEGIGIPEQQLEEIFNPFIQSNKTNTTPVKCPTNIPYQTTTPFYQIYTIDPSGCLFGTNVCTANNYLRNLTYNPPSYNTTY